MRVYLAGRYSRREELFGYSKQLVGHKIVSSWLSHDDSNLTDEEIAHRDLLDVMRCEWLISFTEDERCPTRGGRHVEFGVQCAKIWIYQFAIKNRENSLFGTVQKHIGETNPFKMTNIGPKEHVFHSFLPVEHFDTWENFCRDKGFCMG